MQQQNILHWDDSPVVNEGLPIRLHAFLYSILNRTNPLSGLSTYELDKKNKSKKNTELIAEELAA